jgi:DNA-binding transcriptional regulator YdaS (Cro superfamily)
MYQQKYNDTCCIFVDFEEYILYLWFMTLQEYINSFPKNERFRLRKRIAEEVGVVEITVRSWANGNRKPGATQVIKIVNATDHAVSASDLRPDVFEKQVA